MCLYFFFPAILADSFYYKYLGDVEIKLNFVLLFFSCKYGCRSNILAFIQCHCMGKGLQMR